MINFQRYDVLKCPCKECPEKGCGAKHNTCEAYAKWRALLDKRNAAEREYHQRNDTMSTDKKKEMWRNKRYGKFRKCRGIKES